ncbi:hypothetical protein ACPTKN_13285, partial [Enterococcus faecalis]
MLTKLGTELEKDVYITRYMSNFTRLVLMSDKEKELTAREEHLLSCEKELCALFYEQFKKQHGRAPDEETLDEQVKKN